MKSRLIGKDPDAGKDSRREEKRGKSQEEMVGWHHRLNGHEFAQTPEDSGGQGRLACCSPGGHKESDMTERLNSNNTLTPEQPVSPGQTARLRLRVPCHPVSMGKLRRQETCPSVEQDQKDSVREAKLQMGD